MNHSPQFMLKDLRSVDSYVIRRKGWTYLNARGDRIDGPLINLRKPGVLTV